MYTCRQFSGILISLAFVLVFTSCIRISPQMTLKFDRMPGGINDLALSPDGTMVVAGGDEGTLYLYNIETGDEIRKFEGHERQITSVAWHPTGKAIISASRRGMKFWDTESGSENADFKVITQMVRAMDITPDGEFILTGNSNAFIDLWRSFDGWHIREFKEHPYMTDLDVSPDQTCFITTSGQGTVILWDIDDDETWHHLPRHSDYVSAVDFSDDGRYAATVGHDCKIIIHDIREGTIAHKYENPSKLFSSGALNCVAFSPDGEYLVTGGRNKEVKIWEVDTGTVTRTLYGHSAEITAVTFTLDGNHVISGDSRGLIRLWDIWMEPVIEVQQSTVSTE